MKLVQILARKLEAWPENVTQIVQDDNGLIKYDGGDKTKMGSSGCVWIRAKNNGGLECDLIACDWKKAIVTRADWEAERAKLKAPKANGDGWVRHRGGKCPVGARGIQIDIRRRNGVILENVSPKGLWQHTGDGFDVMAWRAHKPAEQPQIKLESGAEIIYSPGEPLVLMEPADTMLTIRDRIRELDTQLAEVESTYQRQISEITQERESLVNLLAGEGLALVEVVVQPVEDMSDWRNWRAGDLIQCIGKSGGYSKGSVYEVRGFDFSRGVVYTEIDDRGRESNGWNANMFRFVSRPAT